MYRVVREEQLMGAQEISVRSWSAASPAEVYGLLRDGATWPVWSPIDSFELERQGADGGENLGAQRIFRTGRATSREEIVELVADRRFSYALLSGLPMRSYRADVDLEPRDGGTAIHWHSTFAAKWPGTGGLMRRALGRFIQRCADGLAAYAAETSERSAPA
jgi:Polyketide cyclase / dehydrase and lipid transport